MNKEKSTSDPEVQISRIGKSRDRIFDCAQDLFHRKGIRGVGVEAIAEAAGTSKMALYRHFNSKDELILEYLNYKGRKSDEIWAEIEAQNPGDPSGQLYGFMDKAAIFIAGDERGCDLANAAIELTEQGHPGLRVIEEFKMRQRERLTNSMQGRRRLAARPPCRHALSPDRGRTREPPQRRNKWPQRQSHAHQPGRHRLIRRSASRGLRVNSGARNERPMSTGRNAALSSIGAPERRSR